MDFYHLLLIIILFSVIQSIVGVGLLLFGTPALLLLGYTYPQVLWILLPASCSLSLMQVVEGRRLINLKSETFLLTMPALAVALVLVIKLNYILDIKKIIGIFLIIISCLKFSQHETLRVQTILGRNNKLGFVLIGIIHGFSNLGGALLSVLVPSIHTQKKAINANIAFVYFNLAISQLTILYFLQRKDFSLDYLIFIPIVILTHFVTGGRLSKLISDDIFKKFVNLVTLIFGVICLL